jgi:hypothetical protein
MNTSNNVDTTPAYVYVDYTLAKAHGTCMVIAWTMFASTGILFARYGRSLPIKGRVQILGELVWFQTHRLALSITVLATLLGFFLVLGQAQGGWVGTDNGRLFAHSICGIIIIGCSQIQLFMAMFRCHSNTRYRFIFNWMHRFIGVLTFTLSIPTIFLITFILPKYVSGQQTILSIWSAWIIIIVIIFEMIEYHSQRTSMPSTDSKRTREVSGTNQPEHFEMDEIGNLDRQNYNKIKAILFCIHIIIAICVSISFIVLIWLQG